MKKLITYVALIMMLVLVTGCSKTEEQAVQPTEVPTESPAEEPTEVPTESPAEEPTEAPTEAPMKEPTEAPTEAPMEEPTEAPTEAPTVQPTEEPTQNPTETPTEAPTERTITIYNTNKEITEMITTEVVIPDLAATYIVDELKKVNVLREDVEVRDCKLEVRDGIRYLYVDFNEAFEESISMTGTAGEAVISGCTANTFIKAYKVDYIKYTVNGSEFESGHMVYDDYFEFSESVY